MQLVALAFGLKIEYLRLLKSRFLNPEAVATINLEGIKVVEAPDWCRHNKLPKET